jgi:hypothetical protein
MTNETTPGPVWHWQLVSRWSAEQLEHGTAASESVAKQTAESRLYANDKAFTAMVFPIGIVDGQPMIMDTPSIGMRAASGIVKWHNPTTRSWEASRRLYVVENR